MVAPEVFEEIDAGVAVTLLLGGDQLIVGAL
jgi:hypothetical protein